MRIAYLDCATGISGDMTLAALIDAGVDPEPIRRAIASLGIDGVELQVAEIVKGGFRATNVDVVHPEQHAHRHLSDIREMVAGAHLSDVQRELALEIFSAVARAEATVHGSTIEAVHFHEVGAVDSIVDIIGAAIGFDMLGVDEVVCSPLPPGRGKVKIDHGICPVPAPGTAELLKGIPLADVPVEAELTTPTGAAIVKVMADRFAALPTMTIEQVGYGAGTMDFPGRANLLRIFVGAAITPSNTDVVCLLETNLDDVSPEVIGYTRERLQQAGALDVYATSIQMKKSRPGTILSVLCRPADAETMAAILFAETGTLGIRRQRIERVIRERMPHAVQTPWGSVAGKLSHRDGAEVVFSPEFESCAELAQTQGVPLREVYRAAVAAFRADPLGVAVTASPGRTDHLYDSSHDHAHDHDHSHDHSHDHDHGHDHG